MATEWFHKSGDDERGPMPFGELVDAARSGKVARTDFVRSNWHKEWQPAESVLGKYFSGESHPPEASQWSETVKEAVAASRARHATGDEPKSRSGREFRNPLRGLGGLLGVLLSPVAWVVKRLFGRFAETFEWLGELGGGPAVWLAFAVPAFIALAAAAAVGLAIEDWSAADALVRSAKVDPARNVGRREALPPPAPVTTGRRIPLLGTWSRGEYLFFLVDIMLVTAVVTYFPARLLLSERPDSNAGPGGTSGGAGAVRKVLGGRAVAVCVLIALAAVVLRNSSIFQSSNERIYGNARGAFERIKELAARKATADEWDALDADVRKKLTPAVDEMIKLAAESKTTDPASRAYFVNYHVHRPLIRIGRHELPALIRDARGGKLQPNRIKNIEGDLDEVRKSLDAMSL